MDAVIVNHIYPRAAMNGYFHKWERLQEEGLQRIAERFNETARFYVELQPQELRTLDGMQEIGNMIFKDCDPDRVLNFGG
ncbi:MAG: ArsA family ATPase [Lachnospiraceae bacterium]|nr:ArsA family ATPase [Lachnospiraceae bacterium]